MAMRALRNLGQSIASIWRQQRYYVLALLLIWSYRSKFATVESRNHIYILRTFFFPGTTTFVHDLPVNAIVILFNMERRVSVASLHSLCLSENPFLHYHKRMGTRVEEIYAGAEDCKIATYRLFCYSVPTFGRKFVRFRKTLPIPLQLTHADPVQRNLVVCPARMLAFEKWQLFITAMELYRLQMVDLVVIHIHSVDADVYELIRLYEMEGFIEIRASLLMPRLDSLDYNPNAETEWNSHMINFQECLYSFRENTQFIAFPDWEDLIVTPHFKPMQWVLNDVLDELPSDVAAFTFMRYMGAIDSLDEMTEQNRTVVDVWRSGIAYTKRGTPFQSAGTLLVRPKFVDVIKVPFAGLSAIPVPPMVQEELPPRYSFILHTNNKNNLELESRLDIDEEMIDNFNIFASEIEVNTLLQQRLPKNETAMDALLNCNGPKGSGDIFGRIVQMVQKRKAEKSGSKSSQCYSYSRCNIGRIRRRCVNARNRWRIEHADRWVISTLQESRFEEHDFCVV